MGKKWKLWQIFFSWAPKSLQILTSAKKLKDACSLEESYYSPRQHIKKQRHCFANKILSSQSCGFTSMNVWMWELDYKESWVLKNWCFLTNCGVGEDSWESLGQHPKGHPSWIFIGRTDAEAEALIFLPPDVKNWLTWKAPDARKDWGHEEKGATENEMVG